MVVLHEESEHGQVMYNTGVRVRQEDDGTVETHLEIKVQLNCCVDLF